MSGKPVAEQEIGHALLQEVVGYAETSMSRRKFLLHYFGEHFDEKTGDGASMDDNVQNPKKKHEAKDEVVLLLKTVKETNQIYKAKEVVNTLIGKANAIILSHKTDEHPLFGEGKSQGSQYWTALVRQVLVAGMLKKDIETYGVVRITDKGKDFIKNPSSFMMTEDHIYYFDQDDSNTPKSASADADVQLVKILKELRKKVAKKQNVPPFVVFQDPSIQDMALKYPISIDELSNIHGVGEGKAKKFGKEFVEVISNYVEENDISRPDDFVVKSTGANSGLKLYIIQNVDRKLPLTDIASAKGMEMNEFIKEMEAIVYSGTKLNIDYWLNDILDDEQQEEIHDYFLEAESDKIEEAIEEFDGDYDDEELRLYRIKFISEVAN